jgi:hypothetical protein
MDRREHAMKLFLRVFKTSLLLPLALLLCAASPLQEKEAKARALYEDLEFEKAALVFEELAADPDASSEKKADFLVWAGMCHAGLSDLDKMGDALYRAVKLNRYVKPPEAAPPKVREYLDLYIQDLPHDDPQGADTPPDNALENQEAVEAEPGAQDDPSDGAVDEETSDEGSNAMIFYLSGGGAGLVGIAAGVGAGVMAVMATNRMAITEDSQAEQVDVIQAQDDANAQLGISYGLAGLSAAALIGAGGLFAAPLFMGE